MNTEAPLRTRIDRDYIDAMKAKDVDRIGAIRMLKAALQSADKASKEPLTEDDVQAVVVREMKMRRESLSEFEKGGRADLAATEATAISFIEPYMPPQLSEDEIRTIVARAVEGLDASARSDPRAAMGLVMRAVMPDVKGKADGNLVNEIVREQLNKGS